jgi:hypothetical protein
MVPSENREREHTGLGCTFRPGANQRATLDRWGQSHELGPSQCQAGETFMGMDRLRLSSS